MSMYEDAYKNLRINKKITVHDLKIDGNLDVSLSQLHAHSYGEFLSNNIDNQYPQRYLRINDVGNFVELGNITENNERSILIQKQSKTDILYSDMHYDHFLNSYMYYRFTSDKDVLLLYTMVNGNISCVPLYLMSSLHDRELEFDLEMQETTINDFEHPYFFHNDKMINLIQRYTYATNQYKGKISNNVL